MKKLIFGHLDANLGWLMKSSVFAIPTDIKVSGEYLVATIIAKHLIKI